MALEQRLQLRQSLQLRMTPQLRQAIKILQLSRIELESMIADELAQNPVLEETEAIGATEREPDSRTGDVETNETEVTVAETQKADHDNDAKDVSEVDQTDWDQYLERNSDNISSPPTGSGAEAQEARDRLFENARAPEGGLPESLVDQLGLLAMNEDERRTATLICHNLDDDGYLACTIDEMAFMSDVTVETVEDAREIVQELEPPGCGSVDLRDCLLVQLRMIGYEADDYVVAVVDGHMPDIESQRYNRIARALGTKTDEILECHKIIRGLDPKPGLSVGETEARYISPDVYIVRVADDFEVVLNDDGLPQLHISPLYLGMLKDGGHVGEAKTYLVDKMRSANWLIRSVEQRQRTLRKVTESIVRHQHQFLREGIEHLKPMVLKDVAADIGMHESTVSRATSSKYVHTPQGLFELKWFFTSALKSTAGGDVSSESVKQRIQIIIDAENSKKPFSDQYIAEQLAKENVD
ncbi:MAG: RNA polymerase sigma-54 factor, partial [Candidatus Binatia bacterium]